MLTRDEIEAIRDSVKNAPIGTKAPAFGGGWWFKTERGWKWNGPDGNGCTFPRPGGDWTGKLIAPEMGNDGPSSPTTAPTPWFGQ